MGAGEHATTPVGGPLLPHLRFDELLDELQARLQSMRATRDRVHRLLDAVVTIGSGLDLDHVLHNITEAAASLVDARYGALGVIGEDGGLARFVTVGISAEQIARIGAYPEGKGILGELIRHPVPLRLHEIAAHPASYGFPPNHPPMTTFLGVPIRVREEVYGNLYLTEKRGGVDFDADDEAVLTALAAAAGVVIDNARLYDEARHRQRWLETTAELTRMLLSGRDLHDVLVLLAEHAADMAGADLVFIALPIDDHLVVEISYGTGQSLVQGHRIPLEGSITGGVFRTGRPVVLAEARGVSYQAALKNAGLGDGPLLLAPIGTAEQVRGVLGLVRRTRAELFDEQVSDMITALAGQAAVVLELAEHRSDAERLTMYADRDRIGRDLHDLAIQRLFAASMTLQSAYKLAEKPAVASRISQVIDGLDDTIKVIRSTIFALHSHETGQPDLSTRSRVLTVCQEAVPALGHTPALRLSGPIDYRLDADTTDHLLAVLREALANVARHAAATRTDVEITVTRDRLEVTVTDNGEGMPAHLARRSGLANLEQRAETLGGELSIEPAADGGTRLRWSVPLSDSHARAS